MINLNNIISFSDYLFQHRIFHVINQIIFRSIKTKKNILPFGYKNGKITKITKAKSYVGKYVFQEHNATNLHIDVRISDAKNKVALSWVARKSMPTKVGKSIKFIRQPDHKVSYMDFQGIIKKGIGKGTVKIVDKGNIFVEPDINKMKVIFENISGRFSIRKVDKDWLCIKMKDSIASKFWEERNKYTLNMPEDVFFNPDYHFSQKLDGANYIMSITNKGNSFVSRRLSVNGNYTHVENKIPHLRDLKISPKYNDYILRGELWHEGPKNRHINGGNVSFLSGILNSNPIKAILTQKKNGEIHYAPFDILSIPHKDVSHLVYADKLAILKAIEKSINSKYFKRPLDLISTQAKVKQSFLHYILHVAKGEGIVIKNLKKVVKEDKWIKNKKSNDYVLKIIGFTKGKGKYENKGISAFKAVDANGNLVAIIGTGLTDDVRIDAYLQPNKYIGRHIEVKAMEFTGEKLRAPVAGDFTDTEVSFIK